MSTPRRSERLAKSLIVTYTWQFIETEKKFRKCTAFISQANLGLMTPEKKVQMLIKLLRFVNASMDLLKQYGNRKYNIFFTMLYKKSFEWIKDAKEKHIIGVPEMLRVFQKFRKKYETSRYASWEFLRSQFNLDENIMFRIDSYM
jgi:hypothetical protein